MSGDVWEVTRQESLTDGSQTISLSVSREGAAAALITVSVRSWLV